MTTCTLHQIRITELTQEVERLRACQDVNHTLYLEAENQRLTRIEEAARTVDASPNQFTLDILHAALACEKIHET